MSAQPAQVAATPASRAVRLNVGVSARDGRPIPGLQAQDFALLDNKSTVPITSFKAMTRGQEPVEAIVVVDAVNASYELVAQVRNGIEKFLRTDGGAMTYPTTVAILTDKGMQIQKNFTKDGNALAASLAHEEIGLRTVTRGQGVYGAEERVQISLRALNELTTYAATLPGRKVVLWVSPGWALLSGPRVDLDARQESQIFGDVVSFSNALRAANLTLYNINPIGVQESLVRADYYQGFLKGVSKPSEVDIGDLGLQVLSVQSGGLAIESNSDIAGNLRRCLADLDAWYELTFAMPPAEHANEYHHVDVKVDKPGLTARTRDGYYAQP